MKLHVDAPLIIFIHFHSLVTTYLSLLASMDRFLYNTSESDLAGKTLIVVRASLLRFIFLINH
jgi:hypothetical protein